MFVCVAVVASCARVLFVLCVCVQCVVLPCVFGRVCVVDSVVARLRACVVVVACGAVAGVVRVCCIHTLCVCGCSTFVVANDCLFAGVFARACGVLCVA